MAREMTPQERAAELAEQISGAHHQLAYPGATVRSLVFDALQQTRRAALLECVQQLREGARLAQSREVANALSGHAYTIDRLAQEGS